MQMNITSRPYQTANPKQCCERCVFGTGKHAEFCHVPRLKIDTEFVRRLNNDYDKEFRKNRTRRCTPKKS